VSEFVPDILRRESKEAGHVRQRRFYDFLVFSSSAKQAHPEVALHGGLAHLPARSLVHRPESRAPAAHQNLGRLAAALYFLIAD
jgi:hypothetical protein